MNKEKCEHNAVKKFCFKCRYCIICKIAKPCKCKEENKVMICIKCNKEKQNTEFRYRHDRKKYYTICKSCVNLGQRIKRNGCEDVREYIERTKGNADETKVYSKKYGLVRNRKCDYTL